MLNNLKRINSRNINQLEQSALEMLLELGDVITSFFCADNPFWYRGCVELYDNIYLMLREKIDFSVSAESIASLIYAKSSYNFSIKESQCFGMYTGALAHYLADISDEPTIIRVSNFKMNYLFFYLRKAGTIILENGEGDNILSHAGSYDGCIKSVFLQDIRSNNILENAAIKNGQIKHVVLDNVEGDNILKSAGTGGKISIILLHNTFGDYALKNIGFDGEIDAVELNKFKGNNLLHVGNHPGNINLALFKDVNLESISERAYLPNIVRYEEQPEKYRELFEKYCLPIDNMLESVKNAR